MKSVKSLARIGSWAQLKSMPAPGSGVNAGSTEASVSGTISGTGVHVDGNGIGAMEKPDKPKPKKKRDKDKAKTATVGKHVKSSSSSWEVGALSSGNGEGGEDTTRSGYGFSVFGRPSAGPGGPGPNIEEKGAGTAVGTGIGRGLPSHLRHQHQQHNTQGRRDSGGTLLSVATGMGSYRSSTSNLNSASSGVAPVADGRRVSGSSSSGGSRPGSTYTASGEDTGGFLSVLRDKEEKRKRKVSVRWGGVMVGGEKGNKLDHDERQREKEEGKREKKERKEREKKEKKEKSSARSLEGRRRTPVTSVFPGLRGMAFGRGEDGRDDGHDASTLNTRASTHIQSNIYTSGAEYTLDAQEVEEGLDDEEEACVRIAVHASIPPFLVRGREEAVIGSNIPQPNASGPQQNGDGSGPQHVAADQEHSAIQLSSLPPARPRLRPMSEQLLGNDKPRPRGIVGSVEHWDESNNEREGECFVYDFHFLCLIC